jgi:HK97 family phage portal protein
VLRPDRVKAVAGPRGWPSAYTYTVDNHTATIAPLADGFLPLLHATLFHPLDDIYGFSPIEAASRAIDVHNAGGAWTKALLDNAARPSGALIYKGPDGAPNLTGDQFERLKRELEHAYQGAGNAGRPMVLEGGLDWKAMSYAPADLDFAQSRDGAAREIALAFGVPPMLLGIPGDNTYSNYREANLSFWRQTVLPLVGRTASSLTRWLCPRFGETLRLGYDADAVDALAQDRESTWDKLNAATFLTLNEKRAAAGYGAVEGGDVVST